MSARKCQIFPQMVICYCMSQMNSHLASHLSNCKLCKEGNCKTVCMYDDCNYHSKKFACFYEHEYYHYADMHGSETTNVDLLKEMSYALSKMKHVTNSTDYIFDQYGHRVEVYTSTCKWDILITTRLNIEYKISEIDFPMFAVLRPELQLILDINFGKTINTTSIDNEHIKETMRLNHLYVKEKLLHPNLAFENKYLQPMYLALFKYMEMFWVRPLMGNNMKDHLISAFRPQPKRTLKYV